MRQELKQAAQQRLESVRAPQLRAVTEVERILLRALVLPEADSARALAAEELGGHPDWFADLASAAVMEALVNAPAPDNPFEAAPDDASRALLARALQSEVETVEETSEVSAARVQSALETLHDKYIERRQRELRAQMDEAQRRGDDAILLHLAQEKLRLDRERKR